MRRSVSLVLTGLLLVLGGCAKKQKTVETVHFMTGDKVEIAGTFYRPKGPEAPAVILVHGIRGNRTHWQSLATALQGAGYAVLTFDMRGHGESLKQRDRELDWMGFSDDEFRKMMQDVLAGFNFLTRQTGVDAERIGVLGSDLGANVALNAAAYERRVRTLVLLSPGLLYKGIRTENEMSKYAGRPVLMIASEDDLTGARSARRLMQLTRGEKELKMYQSGGHGMQLFDRAPDVKDVIFDWLKKTL